MIALVGYNHEMSILYMYIIWNTQELHDQHIYPWSAHGSPSWTNCGASVADCVVTALHCPGMWLRQWVFLFDDQMMVQQYNLFFAFVTKLSLKLWFRSLLYFICLVCVAFVSSLCGPSFVACWYSIYIACIRGNKGVWIWIYFMNYFLDKCISLKTTRLTVSRTQGILLSRSP